MALLRVYWDPDEIDSKSGYPHAWHRSTAYGGYRAGHSLANPAIKDLIRDRDGHRCLRCGHPYRKGEHGNGQWSPCDEHCTHTGPARINGEIPARLVLPPGHDLDIADTLGLGNTVEAKWRILTVHHLNGVKYDCRWWNLVSLCQRCHLTIQGKVRMERPWVLEHSDWFKPYVAAYYASVFLNEDLTREQTEERLDELLDLQPHTTRLSP